MKKVVVIVLVLAMVLALVSCGGKGSEAGKYKFVEMEAFGQKVTLEQYKTQFGVSDEELDKVFSLELREDGTMTIVANGDEATGTYGDGKMTIDGVAVPYESKGGKITITIEESGMSMKMVFEKAN